MRNELGVRWRIPPTAPILHLESDGRWRVRGNFIRHQLSQDFEHHPELLIVARSMLSHLDLQGIDAPSHISVDCDDVTKTHENAYDFEIDCDSARAAEDTREHRHIWGSAAWKTAPRDRWIGWTHEQRKDRLHLIVNNTLPDLALGTITQSRLACTRFDPPSAPTGLGCALWLYPDPGRDVRRHDSIYGTLLPHIELELAGANDRTLEMGSLYAIGSPQEGHLGLSAGEESDSLSAVITLGGAGGPTSYIDLELS